MFAPDDPTLPANAKFDEPWHAQVLAMANTMIEAGHFSAGEWAECLGAELREAAESGKPDRSETYYHAALTALEKICDRCANIATAEQKRRKADWIAAYERTPHGQPVVLSDQGGGRR